MTRSDVIGLVDRVNGAVLRALAAADALVSVDREAEQVLADARRALLVNNVRNILVAEETEGRKNGVRRSLSEAAERVGLDVSAKRGIKSDNNLFGAAPSAPGFGSKSSPFASQKDDMFSRKVNPGIDNVNVPSFLRPKN